jgi:hydroxypyruvate reductase
MTETRTGVGADLELIWREALRRTQAVPLVREALAAETLPPGPVRVVALGKAAFSMMEAALGVLGTRAADPLCIVPEGGRAELAGVEVLVGSHPRPSLRSVAAGTELLAWARRNAGMSVLALVSGGGSALAVAPAEGVTFEEKVEATAALMRAGATIGELNALRKHLSRLKGGQLAARLSPAPVTVLVLSDVPGDDLSTIASGPFAPDPTTFADALGFVRGRRAHLPIAAIARLEAGARGELAETPKPGDPRLARVTHRLLAGPVDLARAAAAAGRARGYATEVDPLPLTGDVRDVAARLVAWVDANAGRGKRLLALGGEPTIAIPTTARAPDGGRAQHLALLAAQALAGRRAAVLAAGSDGRDGPTDQAGAVVDGGTAAVAARAGVDLAAALAEARSGPAAVASGAAIPREETGTHLCDLVLAAVE